MYDWNIIHFDPRFVAYTTYLLSGKCTHTSQDCIKQPKTYKSCSKTHSQRCSLYAFVLRIHHIFHKHHSNVCAQILATSYSNILFLNLGSHVFIKAGMAMDHYLDLRLNEHGVWAEFYGIIEWACVFDWSLSLLQFPQMQCSKIKFGCISIFVSISLLFLS